MNINDKRYFSDQAIAAIRAKYPVERTVDEALTWKLQRRRGCDYRLTDMEELSVRLSRFIADQVTEPFHITALTRLPGGGSKEMFRFTLHRQAATGDSAENLILRMNPGESIAETHRLREFQVMKAMKGVVPVPDTYWVDADGAVLGNSAMVCGFVTGIAKPSKPQGKSGSVSGIGAGFPKEQREPLLAQFIAHLVAIQNFRWQIADLSAFDVPRAGTVEAASLSLNQWSRVWEEDCFEEHPVITLAAQWLTNHLPIANDICLVHNDYRNGNFLYNEDTAEITAILDWELARLGDYHEDLAWILFQGFASPDENGTPLVCGLAPRDEFIKRYEEQSGRSVDEKKLHYYTVLNLYKLAILGSATNARAAADRQTHLDVMMNLSTGLGYSALCELYQILNAEEASQ